MADSINTGPEMTLPSFRDNRPPVPRTFPQLTSLSITSMVHQQVITDIATCDVFTMMPHLKNALLCDMAVWHEQEEWHMSFRVDSPNGPGRDYIHVTVDADTSPNSVRVSYSTSQFVRYLPDAHTEVFKTDLRQDATLFFTTRIFNDILEEQIRDLDLPNKRLLPDLKAHQLPLLFIMVVVETLEEADLLPFGTFAAEFLPVVESRGYEMAWIFDQT